MNRFMLPLGSALTIALAISSTSLAQVSAADQAFLDKHMSEIVAVKPKRLNDPAIAKTISAPIYELTISINSGDGGNMESKQIAAQVDDKLMAVSRPSTDSDCPAILKMVNPTFTLKTDDDAKLLQSAFDTLFPSISDDDKKAVAFAHTGNDWMFYRGTFFKKKLGFVITTDDAGKVKGVKFSLQL